MFNRKKREIERLKNNITKLNENRMELSGENIRLQKEVANLNAKFDILDTKYDMINNAILGLYELVQPKIQSKPKKVKTTNVKVNSSTFDLEEKKVDNKNSSNKDLDKWFFTDYPKVMKKSGYNQPMLAKEMGVSVSSICSLNKKDRSTSTELKQRVKNFLLEKVKENGTK